MEQGNLLSSGTADAPRVTRETLVRLLAAGLNPAGRGDSQSEQRLAARNGITFERPRPSPDRPPTLAGVLVPLVERPEGIKVLLTQRTDHLSHHPGQISFPGGRLEPEDGGDSIIAALRETEEEIGLPRQQVEVVGRLDTYITGTAFEIMPVVGLVKPPFTLTLDAFEVAEVFEVPLDFFLDLDNYKVNQRVFQGQPRMFWSVPWESRFIWGATAGILLNLGEVLGQPE